MLDNNTMNKLHEMKLGAMAAAFRHQLEDKKLSELSFEERIGLMVDAEWTSRRNNRLTRLLKNAGFTQVSNPSAPGCLITPTYSDRTSELSDKAGNLWEAFATGNLFLRGAILH